MRAYIPKNAKLVPESATRVFKGVIFDVYQWQQELFDGRTTTFEMLKRPDTVQVIAVKDNKIIILNQEQPGQGTFYDIPSGRHDVESETELEAAQRETLEETGMRFASWNLVRCHQPHTKIDWLVYTYVATDFIQEVAQKLDAGERIEVFSKSFEEAKELVGNPKARYRVEIFDEVSSLDDLIQLPAIST
jgi:ADP-ribose pyrophosphatase